MTFRSFALATVILICMQSQLLEAQSMPAGQVSSQIEKKSGAFFQRKLREQLQGSNVPEADSISILNAVTPSKSHAIAVSKAQSTASGKSKEAQTAVKAAADATTPQTCDVAGAQNYSFRFWLPAWGCSSDAIIDFFKVSGSISIVDTVQYLYSPNQSTNQVNADFFTATFVPGFQAVFAGTATAGSSQASTTSQSATSTASVSTAVSKLEQGGDFNVRFPLPLLFHAANSYGVYVLSSPSVGFNVSGLSGQNTITQSTEYNVNVPLELYAQTASIEKTGNASNAVLYVDLKPGVEVVSTAFASAIGLKSNRYFFLGQAAAGIEFFNSVRVGFQYFFGPSQVYQVPSGNGSITQNSKIGGVHLVVSFSPPKSGS